jgi:hypothetical protein
MRKLFLLLPMLLGCSLLQRARSSAFDLSREDAVERDRASPGGCLRLGSAPLRTGVAEVKIDAILNAAGASIPVKVARTVELQRPTGSARP